MGRGMGVGMVEDVAASARRLAAGVGVEVAAVVPVRGGLAGPPFLVAAGSPGGVPISPARVFRALLSLRAEAAVLVHVHLRDVGPSPADLAVTRRLVAAGVLLGIPLLAHLVIEPSGWTDCLAEAALRRPYPPPPAPRNDQGVGGDIRPERRHQPLDRRRAG